MRNNYRMGRWNENCKRCTNSQYIEGRTIRLCMHEDMRDEKQVKYDVATVSQHAVCDLFEQKENK